MVSPKTSIDIQRRGNTSMFGLVISSVQRTSAATDLRRDSMLLREALATNNTQPPEHSTSSKVVSVMNASRRTLTRTPSSIRLGCLLGAVNW